MMIRPTGAPSLGTTIALALALCGCSVLSPQKDQTRYFVLTPIADPSQSTSSEVANGSQMLTVGLGPISLPPYLERPEVITRLNNSEFSVSETDHWGESLDSNVARVLGQDLSGASPRINVIPFPWGKKTRIDYKVSLEFLRLEQTVEGKVKVVANWTIRRGADNNKVVRRGTTVFSAAAGNNQISATAALSEGVADVADEIVQILEGLPQARDVASMPNSPASIIRC
jgi:uncharacterized protein